MRLALLLVLSAALLGCQVQFNSGASDQAQAREGSAAEQAALRTAAAAVLNQLDTGQWDKAWSAAAASLRQTTSRPGFATGVRASRAMFGVPASRTIIGYSFSESVEGVPPGQYGIVFYVTDFSKVRGIEEQVVLLQEDGEWRLAGYWAEKRKQVKLL